MHKWTTNERNTTRDELFIHSTKYLLLCINGEEAEKASNNATAQVVAGHQQGAETAHPSVQHQLSVAAAAAE